MSRKYLIIICLAISFVICVSPVIAGDDTYSVNVEGIDFNIPNDYKLDEEFIFEEDIDSQDRWGNKVPVHYRAEFIVMGRTLLR